jgi:hypothetical protein
VNELLPVFINDQVLRLAPGAVVSDAVTALGAEAAGQLAAGSGHVTDGRGIRLEPGSPLHAGAILRFIVSARRRR